MTHDDRLPLDERWTTERAMRTGVPEGTVPFPDVMPEPVDLALDALAAAGLLGAMPVYGFTPLRLLTSHRSPA